jgi:hypothetical protein
MHFKEGCSPVKGGEVNKSRLTCSIIEVKMRRETTQGDILFEKACIETGTLTALLEGYTFTIDTFGRDAVQRIP